MEFYNHLSVSFGGNSFICLSVIKHGWQIPELHGGMMFAVKSSTARHGLPDGIWKLMADYMVLDVLLNGGITV